MANPEMGPREPEEEIPQNQEEAEEKEQTPEEVLVVINEALESGKEVLLTQAGSDGKSFATNVAMPYSIERNFLTVEADGYGFDIEISSIKRAELVEKEKEE